MGEHVTASGLFVRDRPRPLVEAALNVAVSVALVGPLGLAGVFVGTIVSYALTTFWRGPYLLFRLRLGWPLGAYWRQYAALALLPVAFSAGAKALLAPEPESWLGWLGWVAAISVAYAACFVAFYGWTDDARAVAATLRTHLRGRLFARRSA